MWNIFSIYFKSFHLLCSLVWDWSCTPSTEVYMVVYLLLWLAVVPGQIYLCSCLVSSPHTLMNMYFMRKGSAALKGGGPAFLTVGCPPDCKGDVLCHLFSFILRTSLSMLFVCSSKLCSIRSNLNLRRFRLILVLKYEFVMFAKCDTGVTYFKYTWMRPTGEKWLVIGFLTRRSYLHEAQAAWYLHPTVGWPLWVYLFNTHSSSCGKKRNILVGMELIWN